VRFISNRSSIEGSWYSPYGIQAYSSSCYFPLLNHSGYFITLLVENGTMYLTSLFGLSGRTIKDGVVVGDPDSDETAAFVAGRELKPGAALAGCE
jgi:hypothetical protein